jgi:hypothetical protein
VAVHVAVVLAIALSVKVLSPPREPPSLVVGLVPPWTPQQEPEKRPLPRTAPPAPLPAPAISPHLAPSPVPATPAPAAAAVGPSEGDIAAVRNALRGTLGCSNARLYHLTAEEEARCAKLLRAQADPNHPLPPLIDPVKRTWFDASLRARKAGQYMPLGVPADYGIGWKVAGTGAKNDNHSIKVGPLNLGLPPGAFNDDDAPPP